MIRSDQLDLVHRWCAWTDEVLASTGDPVFVHGDLHGYNQVWDQHRLRLCPIADFETEAPPKPITTCATSPPWDPGSIC